jgi:hypothetical protein
MRRLIGRASTAGVRDPPTGFRGASQLRPRKGSCSSSAPPTTPGTLLSQPAHCTCTPCPRSCTHSVQLDEGSLHTLEASKSGHFSIVYDHKRIPQISFYKVGVQEPQTGTPSEVIGAPLRVCLTVGLPRCLALRPACSLFYCYDSPHP